jgi:hypothetical protein
MMTSEDKATYLAELKYRIEADLRFFNGKPPDTVVTLWSGYLAGILENSVITIDEYVGLDDLLPKIEANPVIDLFRGRHEISEEDEEDKSLRNE